MNKIKTLLFGIGATLLLVLPCFAQSQIKAGKAITMFISGVPAQEKSLVDGTYPVSASGMINLPHIGPVRAAGLLADQLSTIIQNTYKTRKIYTNPTVQILTSDQDKLDEQLVHVGGYVGTPGPVKFTQGLTLYQAVQAARGATAFGSMYRVMLYRDGKLREVDLTQAPSKSIVLQPNDTIEVPQKNVFGR